MFGWIPTATFVPLPSQSGVFSTDCFQQFDPSFFVASGVDGMPKLDVASHESTHELVTFLILHQAIDPFRRGHKPNSNMTSYFLLFSANAKNNCSSFLTQCPQEPQDFRRRASSSSSSSSAFCCRQLHMHSFDVPPPPFSCTASARNLVRRVPTIFVHPFCRCCLLYLLELTSSSSSCSLPTSRPSTLTVPPQVSLDPPPAIFSVILSRFL